MLDDQQVYLLGWLKVAIESLRSGNLRVGQALCFAGAKDCGKSLLQDIIYHPAWGQKARSPTDT